MERPLNYNLARMSFVVHVMGKFGYASGSSGCFVDIQYSEAYFVSDFYQYLTYQSLLSY